MVLCSLQNTKAGNRRMTEHDARSTVTFPQTELHHSLDGTKLHYFVAMEHV